MPNRAFMEIVRSRLRAMRVASMLLGAAVWFVSSAAGAVGATERIAPSYHGTTYERFAIPGAAYRRALPVGPATNGPRYRVIDLGAGRASMFGATRIPVAIDREERVLLAGYRLGPAAGLLPNDAIVVNADGASLTLREECPACDPTPSSQSAFIAFALGDGGAVVGSWNDYLPGRASVSSHEAYDLTYFVRWALQGRSIAVAQVGFGTRDAAYAINARGIAAGQDGTFAAIFARNGYATDLGTLQRTHCDARATAIDDAGVVAGFACAGDSSVAVTFPPRGPAVPLGERAAPSAALAINASGSIAGFSGATAAVWARGRTTFLPFPPLGNAASAVAYAIDDAGDVAGDVYFGERGTQSVGGFLYARGRTYAIDALLPRNSGWHIVHVTGMDWRGDILGVGVRAGVFAPVMLRLR
ncbi:MAG: hypothetical protein M3R53_05865 [Candidatus Eremiobacteraeota bacterium]|nr:hypothetical protein [Candidatus Eremiobacteraeota bacterium]